MTTQRWIALGSVLLLLVVLMGPTLKSYISQRNHIAELQAQIARQKDDIAALEHEYELWQKDEYVEQQARARLKFVMPGETAYTLVDADPSIDAGSSASLTQRTGDGPWYGQLWTSIKVADNPQRVADQ